MSDWSNEDGWKAFQSVTAIAVAAVIAAWRRLSTRVDGKVSRKELEKVIEDQIEKEGLRQKTRDEMHGQNTAALNRIEKTLNAHEAENADFRHKTRDQMQAMVAQLAVLNDRLPGKRR